MAPLCGTTLWQALLCKHGNAIYSRFCNMPCISCVLWFDTSLVKSYITVQSHRALLAHARPTMFYILLVSRYRYIIFVCTFSFLHSTYSCAVWPSPVVHSPAAVCLHRSVCIQVLIKYGFLYTWIPRPPACLCNVLEDGNRKLIWSGLTSLRTLCIKVVFSQAVNDSTLPSVSYTAFIPALTQP